MKRFFLPAVSVLTIALLGACVDDHPPRRSGKKSGFHPPPPYSDTQIVSDEPSTTDKPEKPEKPERPPTTENKPPPSEPPVKVGEIPYAKPVPGKPGFVFSPYEQYKGYIDVRGFPPGTEVKDPYSQKSFLVP